MNRFEDDISKQFYENLVSKDPRFHDFWVTTEKGIKGKQKTITVKNKKILMDALRNGNNGLIINGRKYVIVKPAKKSWSVVLAMGRKLNAEGRVVKNKANLANKYINKIKTAHTKEKADQIYIDINEERNIPPEVSKILLMIANHKDILEKSMKIIERSVIKREGLQQQGWASVYDHNVATTGSAGTKPLSMGKTTMKEITGNENFDQQLTQIEEEKRQHGTNKKKMERDKKYYEKDNGEKKEMYKTAGGKPVFKKRFKTGVIPGDMELYKVGGVPTTGQKIIREYNKEVTAKKRELGIKPGQPVILEDGSVMERAERFTSDYKKKAHKYNPKKYKVPLTKDVMVDETGKMTIKGKMLRIDLLEDARFGIYFRGQLLPMFDTDMIGSASNSWRLINNEIPNRDRALFWQMTAQGDKEAIKSYITYYNLIHNIPIDVINTALYYANTPKAQRELDKIVDVVARETGDDKLYVFNVNPAYNEETGETFYFKNEDIGPDPVLSLSKDKKSIIDDYVESPFDKRSPNNMKIILYAGTGKKIGKFQLPKINFDPKNREELRMNFYQDYVQAKEYLTKNFKADDKESPGHPIYTAKEARKRQRGDLFGESVDRSKIKTDDKGFIDDNELSEIMLNAKGELLNEQFQKGQREQFAKRLEIEAEEKNRQDQEYTEAMRIIQATTQREGLKLSQKTKEERQRIEESVRRSEPTAEDYEKLSEQIQTSSKYSQDVSMFEPKDDVPDISIYGHSESVQKVCRKFGADFTLWKNKIRFSSSAPSKDYNTRKKYTDLCLMEYGQIIHIDRLVSDYDWEECLEIETIKRIFNNYISEKRQSRKSMIKLYQLLADNINNTNNTNTQQNVMEGLTTGFILNTEMMNINPSDIINQINKNKAQNVPPVPGEPTPGEPVPGAPTPGAPTPGEPVPGAPTPEGPTNQPTSTQILKESIVKPREIRQKATLKQSRQHSKRFNPKVNNLQFKFKRNRLKQQLYVNLGKQNPPDVVDGPLNFKFK